MPEGESPFLLKYCRTCASDIVTGVNIFGEEGKRLRISEKLRKTLSVLVFEEDLLPKRLCIDCCTTLEGFSQYKESVFDAQEKLKGISKNLSLTKDSNGQRLSDKEPAVYSHSKGSEEENISTTGKAHEKEYEAENADAVECEVVQLDGQDESPSITEVKGVVGSSEDGASKFHCEFCEDIFLDATAYYSHIAASHKGRRGRRYRCGFCSNSYAQKASLTIHVTSHHASKESHQSKTHVCATCQAAFHSKKLLERHTKTHVLSREYPCYICNKHYKTSKCLAKHVSLHLCANKFICTVCHKGFNRKSRLLEHQNTHSPDSSLGCPFCIKTFNSYPNYLKHLRSKHEEKWADGEKAPPPIKNGPPSQVQPPTPHPDEPDHNSSSAVGHLTIWPDTETPSSSKPSVNGMISLNLDSAMQSNSTATSHEGNLTQAHNTNQPMELCYKLATSDFQDMPMELTKVFQDSGPLELCVRNDTETEFSELIDLTSANPKESQNFQGKLDLIDLSGVAPFQQQPMDLINRDSCYNLSSVNNSMDLSLRSSFTEQSTSSFIRELLDLSSRTDHQEQSHHVHHHSQTSELNLSSSTKHQQLQQQQYRGAHSTSHNFLNVYSDTLF